MHSTKPQGLSKQSSIFERAIKMPQSEFEYVISKQSNESSVFYDRVAAHFGVSVDDVIKRGEELHLWILS